MTIQTFIKYINERYGPNITYRQLENNGEVKFLANVDIYEISHNGNPLDVIYDYELKKLKPNTTELTDVMHKLMYESSLYT